MKSIKELEEQFQEKLKDFFIVKSIENINHKPHLFMIGTEHISFCADNYGGMLGDTCIQDRNFPVCSMPKCNLTYEEHTSDKVLMLSLVKELTSEKVRECLKDLPLKENKIDGIVLVDTPEKFRII